MTVAECAKIFIKKFEVKRLDYSKLNDIINYLGFKIKRFDSYSQRSKNLLIELDLVEYAKYNKCFTYSGKDMKLVFLSDFLKEKDSIVLLLHEIGHIMLEHIFNDKGLISDNVAYENEANEFAFLVQKQVQRIRIKKGIGLTALYATLSICCATIFFLGYKELKADNTTSTLDNSAVISEFTDTEVQSSTQSVTTTTTETTTTVTTTTAPDTTTTTTEPATTTEDEDTATYSNEIYYVTKTGKKYHREDCYHITGRSVVGMNLEDLEQMGYQPCFDCIGDK